MEKPSDPFRVANGRAVVQDPLEAEGIRYSPILKEWRLCVVETPNKITVRTIDRSEIARRFQVAEPALAIWENAYGNAGFTPSPFVTLDVRDDGTVVSEQPLLAWNYAYYPNSRLWRRTRSHRDEVPSAKVAKRVGVPSPLLHRWETARLSQSATDAGAEQ